MASRTNRMIWTDADYAEIRPCMDDAAWSLMTLHVMKARHEKAKKLPMDQEGQRRLKRAECHANIAQNEATAAGKKLYEARRAIEKRKRAAARRFP